GSGQLPRPRTGRPVPPALGCGVISTYAEDSDAHGDAADQESGDGAQGGGDPSAGVQPDPGADGGGGAGRGGEPAGAQLRGSSAYRAVVRGESSVRSDVDRGGPPAAVGVDRSEARGRPSGSLRAACGEAASEALSAAVDAEAGRPTLD